VNFKTVWCVSCKITFPEQCKRRQGSADQGVQPAAQRTERQQGNRYDAQHKNVKQSAANLVRAAAVEQHPVRSLSTSWLHSSEQRQNESTHPDDASGGREKRKGAIEMTANRMSHSSVCTLTQRVATVDTQTTASAQELVKSWLHCSEQRQNKLTQPGDASCEKGKGAAALPWTHLDISQIVQSESQPEHRFGSS
jgi:hypothetical protein